MKIVWRVWAQLDIELLERGSLPQVEVDCKLHVRAVGEGAKDEVELLHGGALRAACCRQLLGNPLNLIIAGNLRKYKLVVNISLQLSGHS